ncbi:hypothetical protein [Pseudorhizobium xiangyangii]|uniref:hypothetical protein n=1 Tax=Pseudorhizobium xiangyangii TaxID=2883104 RepID=UPI001D00017A|nr:hypothetical protein [Neorhizobium xiangyangii]
MAVDQAIIDAVIAALDERRARDTFGIAYRAARRVLPESEAALIIESIEAELTAQAYHRDIRRRLTQGHRDLSEQESAEIYAACSQAASEGDHQ